MFIEALVRVSILIDKSYLLPFDLKSSDITTISEPPEIHQL